MTGIELIEMERERQIQQEGWTPEHDDQHEAEQLACAAAAYAVPARIRDRMTVLYRGKTIREFLWSWSPCYWKPSPENRIKELAKAGALIAAEIDRLQRAKK